MKVTAAALAKLQLRKLEATPLVADLAAHIDWTPARGLGAIKIDDPAILRLTAPAVAAWPASAGSRALRGLRRRALARLAIHSRFSARYHLAWRSASSIHIRVGSCFSPWFCSRTMSPSWRRKAGHARITGLSSRKAGWSDQAIWVPARWRRWGEAGQRQHLAGGRR